MGQEGLGEEVERLLREKLAEMESGEDAEENASADVTAPRTADLTAPPTEEPSDKLSRAFNVMFNAPADSESTSAAEVTPPHTEALSAEAAPATAHTPAPDFEPLAQFVGRRLNRFDKKALAEKAFRRRVIGAYKRVA